MEYFFNLIDITLNLILVCRHLLINFRTSIICQHSLCFNFTFYFNRHRACNIFARTYFELWLQEENVGQEIMIEDLTVTISKL